jgi:hypothetical protein
MRRRSPETLASAAAARRSPGPWTGSITWRAGLVRPTKCWRTPVLGRRSTPRRSRRPGPRMHGPGTSLKYGSTVSFWYPFQNARCDSMGEPPAKHITDRPNERPYRWFDRRVASSRFAAMNMNACSPSAFFKTTLHRGVLGPTVAYLDFEKGIRPTGFRYSSWKPSLVPFSGSGAAHGSAHPSRFTSIDAHPCRSTLLELNRSRASKLRRLFSSPTFRPRFRSTALILVWVTGEQGDTVQRPWHHRPPVGMLIDSKAFRLG